MTAAIEEIVQEPDHEWLSLPDPAHGDFYDPALATKLSLFTPLVKHGGKLWTFTLPDPYKVAFTWDPDRLTEVAFKEVTRIHTVHKCGYYGLVKPSLAEVVAQIDQEGVNAFYIDMDRTVGIYRSGLYQRLVTVLGNVGG